MSIKNWAILNQLKLCIVMSGILWFTGFLLDQILLYDINTKDHNIWLKIQNFANFKHCGSIYVE